MGNHAQEVHLTRSTHDRKRTWQEVCRWTTTRPWEEGRPGENIFKKVLEAEENNQSQMTLTRSNQSDIQNKRVLTELRRNIQL